VKKDPAAETEVESLATGVGIQEERTEHEAGVGKGRRDPGAEVGLGLTAETEAAKEGLEAEVEAERRQTDPRDPAADPPAERKERIRIDLEPGARRRGGGGTQAPAPTTARTGGDGEARAGAGGRRSLGGTDPRAPAAQNHAETGRVKMETIKSTNVL